tara:strand:+ start:120 stop:362 length:243 start_codon:yes stop_codon:yes gene_type:complete
LGSKNKLAMGKMKRVFIEKRREELEESFIENQYKSNILFTENEKNLLINLLDEKIEKFNLEPILVSILENLKIKININTK